MKTIDLKPDNKEVKELSSKDLLTIEGGRIFPDPPFPFPWRIKKIIKCFPFLANSPAKKYHDYR